MARISTSAIATQVATFADGGANTAAKLRDHLTDQNDSYAHLDVTDALDAAKADASHTHTMSEVTDAGTLATADKAAALTFLNAEDGATADQSASEIQAAYEAQVPAASQAEMEAGTEAADRRMSPLRVAQAIAEQAGAEAASVGEAAILIENASGDHVGQIQPVGVDLSIPGEVADGVYEKKLRVGATWSTIDVKVSTGELTLTIALNGTAITGANGITVDQTTRTAVNLTAANTNTALQFMTITIASSTAEDFQLSVNGTRTAFALS